jgi:hypothetical protein
MFQSFVIRSGSKNMCVKEIGLRAQNALLEFYSTKSIFNTIGVNLYDHSRRKTIFTLIMNKHIHMSSKYYEENG